MKLASTGPFLCVLYGLTAAANIVYIYVPKRFTWADAQIFCKIFYTNMSYITSEEELQMLQESAGSFSNGWIGLYRETVNSSNWLWSSGHEYNFSKLNRDVNVAYDCVYATQSTWLNSLCEVKRNFFCYNNFNLSPKNVNKTWEDALRNCRSYHTDLAGATSQKQFNLLSAANENSTTSAVWIGLRFLTGQWTWVSGCFRYQNFNGSLPSCPIEPYRCGAYNKITGQLENRDCEQKLNFICY